MPATVAQLAAAFRMTLRDVADMLDELERDGLAEADANGLWSLTPEAEAEFGDALRFELSDNLTEHYRPMRAGRPTRRRT